MHDQGRTTAEVPEMLGTGISATYSCTVARRCLQDRRVFVLVLERVRVIDSVRACKQQERTGIPRSRAGEMRTPVGHLVVIVGTGRNLCVLELSQLYCQPTLKKLVFLLWNKREADPGAAILIGVYHFSGGVNQNLTRWKHEAERHLRVDRYHPAALQS